MTMVADLTKHLFSLGHEAIEEIADILQVTVAPSTTTQSTAQSTFITAYENADAIKKSLFTRGIARTDPSGGGIALIFPAAQRLPHYQRQGWQKQEQFFSSPPQGGMDLVTNIHVFSEPPPRGGTGFSN